MTKEQIIVSIIVALLGVIGTSAAAVLGFLQFYLKRKDEKDEEALKKMVAEMISKADDNLRGEFNDGLVKRGEEGKERFDINSRQIEENARLIKEAISIQKNQSEKFDKLVDSVTALTESTNILAETTKSCADGVKSTLYDKIYIVAEKAIKRKGITADERANIKQLYDSYSALGGNGKAQTYVNICLHELETITEEESRSRDVPKLSPSM